MNYRLRDRVGTRRQATRSSAMLAALVLVLLALRIFAPAFSANVIHAIFSPFMKTNLAIDSASVGAADSVKSKDSLIAENAELRAELDDAQRKYALGANLQAENDELRKLLGLTATTTRVVALVLSKPPLSPYDSLVVEFGAGKPVKAGDKLYAEGNILLGEIIEVNGTDAVAKLYSTAGSEIDATIERNNITQKAVGVGGGNFEIKAPKEVDVVMGDELVIPGLEKKVLGIVRQIEAQPTDAFQRVLVKSPVNIFQLKWVTIESKS